MSKVKNAAWRFFASVKLALISLFVLAAVSIIGTLIKQEQEAAYYIQQYGANTARVLELLDITDMYNSWWYVALLCLFGINLIVCSIERLPSVWRVVRQDNLKVVPDKLEKMRFTYRTDVKQVKTAAAETISRSLDQAGWKRARRLDRDDSILFFAQKGAWTRLSVYLVHLSVLVILAGALLGSFFGFKAYVYLSEGRSTGNIYLQSTREAVPLTFELKNEGFARTFYPNGMVKQLSTDLSVQDPQREEPYRKTIIVNDPLTYGGFTFYQGDSYPLQEYYIMIRNRKTGTEQEFRVPPRKNVAWPGTGISFEIVEVRQDDEGALQQADIRFTFEDGTKPFFIRIGDDDRETIQVSGDEFDITFRQYYTTLLLVTRDPGVLIVYLGCTMMLFGLAVGFFLSHRRLWVLISPGDGQRKSVLVSGSSNKNKAGFKRCFQELVDLIEGNNAASAIVTPKKK